MVQSLKAEDRRLNSRISEFEFPRLDLVSIGSEFFVSVGHKGVTGHNIVTVCILLLDLVIALAKSSLV